MRKKDILKWIENKLRLTQNEHIPCLYLNDVGTTYLVVTYDDYYEVYNDRTQKKINILFEYNEITTNEVIRIIVNKLMEVGE